MGRGKLRNRLWEFSMYSTGLLFLSCGKSFVVKGGFYNVNFYENEILVNMSLEKVLLLSVLRRVWSPCRTRH